MVQFYVFNPYNPVLVSIVQTRNALCGFTAVFLLEDVSPMMLDFPWISVCSAQACFFSTQFVSLYLPELVPYVSFHSVCLNGPVVVCLSSTCWFSSYFLSGRFLLILVCFDQISCLQMFALGGYFLSVWFEPYVSFLPVSCLRVSNDVCLNWFKVSFQVSVWDDQLMYVWTEPCVSFCQRLLRVSISVCFSWCSLFLFCKCLSREGPMDVFLDWTQILLSVLGLSAGFNLYLL